jgi:hypothetical protein
MAALPLSDLAAGLDPVRFAAACGFPSLDSWQAEVLRSAAPRILLNCSRQAGKSLTVAVVAAHEAIYQPGSLILLVSPTQRQSGELMRKVLDCYRALGRPVDAEAENRLSLELSNRSRIVALPGKEANIRSYSGVRLLLVDEASRVSDDLMAAVRPMLAVSGGRLIALSTPAGRRGWWSEAWHEGGPTWERYEIPASACPRISPAFLEEERRTLGEYWFEQEYHVRFLESEQALFRREDVLSVFSPAVEAWDL